MSLRGECVNGRWSEEVMEALPNGEVVYSRGIKDYQGNVSFIARLDDGNWLHCEWSYGSCSGCDEFEDMKGVERAEAFRGLATTMDADTMGDYLVRCIAEKASWLVPDDDDFWGRYEEHTGLSVSQLLERVAAEARS